MKLLRELGLLGNKHIPHRYKTATHDHRFPPVAPPATVGSK